MQIKNLAVMPEYDGSITVAEHFALPEVQWALFISTWYLIGANYCRDTNMSLYRKHILGWHEDLWLPVVKREELAGLLEHLKDEGDE